MCEHGKSKGKPWALHVPANKSSIWLWLRCGCWGSSRSQSHRRARRSARRPHYKLSTKHCSRLIKRAQGGAEGAWLLTASHARDQEKAKIRSTRWRPMTATLICSPRCDWPARFRLINLSSPASEPAFSLSQLHRVTNNPQASSDAACKFQHGLEPFQPAWRGCPVFRPAPTALSYLAATPEPRSLTVTLSHRVDSARMSKRLDRASELPGIRHHPHPSGPGGYEAPTRRSLYRRWPPLRPGDAIDLFGSFWSAGAQAAKAGTALQLDAMLCHAKTPRPATVT